MSSTPEAGPNGPPPSEVLAQATKAYKDAWTDKTQPLRPEVVSGFFSALWQSGAKRAGFTEPLRMPQLEHTADDLTALREKGIGIVIMPDDERLEGPEGFASLQKMFPELPIKGYVLQDAANLITPGVLEIEMNRLAPYGDSASRLDEEEARDYLMNKGLRGQTVGTYLVGSLTSKAINDHYFDERVGEEELSRGPVASRLLGTKEVRDERDLGRYGEPTGGLVAEYKNGGVQVTRTLGEYHEKYGIRSERRRDDPEPEREGAEGYEWIDAIALSSSFPQYTYPRHALSMPVESPETITSRNRIVSELVHRPLRVDAFTQEVPVGDPLRTFLIFSAEQDRNGVRDYRKNLKRLLEEANRRLREEGLPLLPTPLPVRVEMRNRIDTSGQVEPKDNR